MSKYLGIAYNLRLPPELKDRIQGSAKSLNRSMNADIVARLDQSFEEKKPDITALATEELMEELSNRFGGLQVTIDAMKSDNK